MLIRRIRYWLRSAQRADELRSEIDLHIEEKAAELRAQGMSPTDALAEARRSFGNVTLQQERSREVWIARYWSDAYQDLRYAIRSAVLRSPLFTCVCVITVALGIGANASVFSIVRHVLLKRITVAQAEELVEIRCFDSRRNSSVGCKESYAGFTHYRENNKVLSGVFAFSGRKDVNVIYQGIGDIATAQWTSADIYPVLQLPPIVGRLIEASDEHEGAQPIGVLSYGYWQKRFGGDPAVIGQSINVDGYSVVIAGVTPREFRGIELGFAPDLTLPLGNSDIFLGRGNLANGGSSWLGIVGRRKPGVDLDRVQIDLQPLFRSNRDNFVASLPPEAAPQVRGIMDGLQLRVIPAGFGTVSSIREELELPLKILLGVTALVLLIACANLSAALLARGLSRNREFGIRAAIGSGRSRLVRLVVVEVLLLTGIGGTIGVILAGYISPVLLRFTAGSTLLDSVDLSVDTMVLSFSFAVTLLTGLLMATGPALRAAAVDPQTLLRESRTETGGSRSVAVLISCQIALAVVLLVGAGLLLQTLSNYRRLDLGYRPDGLVVFDVNPGLAGYDRARTMLYLTEAVRRLESLPGVRSATIASSPMGELNAGGIVGHVPGLNERPVQDRLAGRRLVDSKFLGTVGLELLRGRDIEDADERGRTLVAVVNESFSEQFFPGQDAVGKQFSLDPTETPIYTIIGIFRDARESGPKSTPQPVAYLAAKQAALGRSAAITLRMSGPMASLMESIPMTMRDIDRTVPIANVRTVNAQIDEALRRELALASLTTLFGALTLLLVSVGIYGVLATAVTRRTREVGVRMALGAAPRKVVVLLARQITTPLVLGLMVGAVAAAILGGLLRSQLFGVGPLDARTFTGALLVFAITSCIAILIPALRAAKIDPAAALRHE